MRECARCKIKKPTEEFGICNSRKDGLQRLCILCNREQAREYYHKEKQRSTHVRRAATRHQKIAAVLDDIKASSRCCACGEGCVVCLDFHHLAEEDKQFILARCVFSVAKILEEVKKCEVICSNCHRKLHAGHLLLIGRRNLDLSPLEQLLDATRINKKYAAIV